ncbi:hypothetical protein BUE80_DR007187 [Diplocarpon rosae]|nr:hypothetical protein BUE80_DR007187 [Diplocarpon rosae]
MLRSPPWRTARCRIAARTTRASIPRPQLHRPAKHPYSTDPLPTYFTHPSVRILGPTLWTLTAVSTIYLGCAAYEAYHEAQLFKSHVHGGPVTYDTIDAAKTSGRLADSRQSRGEGFSDSPTSLWSGLSSASKTLGAVMVSNVAVFAVQRLSPETFLRFSHVPAAARNFTLLTSMFGHGGVLHLAINMYALANFGPPLARSPTFEASGSHLGAFYLSAGLLASLSQHLNTVWPKKSGRRVPALGASGAIYAVLGAWALSYPDSRIGIILLPGSIPASEALLYIVAFEAWGTFIGWGLSFGHAAHLGGLLAGAAYVHFDGKNRLWKPAKRRAFDQMKRLKMV